ncbi:BspA family leucine-rich repeat surface protein, partial [Helicobacter bizzozeronii]|uniref:BspA family leucine-rich repeat surface protein n=1 Tax=Helicobacter bizzozeronii TaxID=56877 RepID=UPI001F2B3AB9
KEELKKLVADESVHLGEIDISQITDLSFVFSNGDTEYEDDETESFERQDFEGLEDWDVSHVTNMEGMFYKATHFNHDISSWNVSNVKNMQAMFRACKSFNQPLNNWDVSRVENMKCLFLWCENFNQPLNDWNVSSVKRMKLFSHF